MKIISRALVVFVFFSSSSVFSAGFQISEQSGTGLGRAFAGFGVIGDDLSMAFYNPAGITQHEGMQVQFTGFAIDGSSRFSDSGSTIAPSPPLAPLVGDNDDGASFAVVPNLYFVMDLTEKIKYGFSITAPYGLKTDYDGDWIGRYLANESELKTVNINPSIGYEINDSFSIGAGVVAEYADATLSQAIFTGGPDGFAEVEGDDWGYGWNIGFMYHPNPRFRFGVGYRSKINHEIRGDNDIDDTPLGGGSFSASATARVDLPETVHAGLYYELIQNKLGLSLGYRWTRWNRLDEIVIQTSSPLVADSILELEWDNSFSANIGFDYFYSDHLTFRAGYMFDESPTSDEFRTPRIPDEDRNWFAIGATYEPNQHWQFDLGYTYILVDDADIDLTEVIAAPPLSPLVVTNNLVGEYDDSDVNILSLQGIYKF